MAGIECNLCNFIPVNYEDWLKHVVRRHRSHPNFHIECQFSSCKYSTKSWSGFRSHFSRCHKRQNISLDFAEETLPLEPFQDRQKLDMMTASLVLKLQAKHKLSNSSTSDIIDSFGWLLNEVRKQAIQQNDEVISDSLSKFNTENKRLKFFVDHCNYIEPKKILMGMQFVAKRGRYREVPNYAYVIPFKESLQCFLNNSEVKYYLDNDHFSPDDINEDICDGELFSNHPLYQAYPRALQILLYYDDLEMTNGLGSHITKHKCAMMYWTIANIPPYMRSKWSSLNLLGICKTSILIRHGLKPFLSDFISTLKDLGNEGITLTIQNENRQFRGTLIAVLGDHPASCFLAGLKQSPSFSHRPCKTCIISNRNMRQVTNSSALVERNQDLHRRRCNELEAMNKNNKKYFSKMWGINFKSPLLEVPFFNLARNVTHDPMHTLWEGLLPYHIALFLQEAINAGAISLKWLNTSISKFQYSYLDSDNKPEIILKKHLEKLCLKQTAAAMVTLTYILPLIWHQKCHILGDKYRNVMHLIVIAILINSPKCTVDTAGELQIFIETYLTEFKQLYPTLNLKPKAHFLLHFPTQMVRYGVLKSISCFRFEAKNNFFKSGNFKNFINIPYSMAKYHQLSSCYNFLNCEEEVEYTSISCKDMVKEGMSHMFIDHYPELIIDFSAKILLPYHLVDVNEAEVYSTPEIIIRGLKYKVQCCLLIGNSDNWPIFAQVESIYVFRDTKFFVVKVLETIDYKWQANAYQVAATNTKKLITMQELRNEWPLPLYAFENHNFITNRYAHFSGGLF